MPSLVQNFDPSPIPPGAIMESSAADKKRNKLGYHRTSVACVHCRRRKIRCLVAADDAQGRCENCIRLRKECQFFPVDQQPPIEKKSRPSSRLETASTDPSTASSSPPTLTGEQTEAYFPYQSMSLGANTDVAGFNAAVFPGNPMAAFAPDRTVPSEFAPHPAMDPSTVAWDDFTTIPDQQMLASMAAGKTMMNMPANVWTPTPGQMAPMPATSPLPGTPTVPSQNQPLNPAPTYTMQPDGSVWQVAPTRSMTFPAQPADMTASYPNPGQFVQPLPADLKRRMTSPAQSFPGVPMNPQSPPSADLQGTPVSVSYPGQPGAMGYPGWQDLNAMSPMSVVQYPMYAGDPVQQAGFGSPPPMGHPGQGQSPP
ncbi:putative C6 finger domain protein [Aspergillus saccharolyticus JOP 1030-1]|uniref:C6 finger domain protein n=1 Tax=Aspergillus saccharolyticus JOP 1030-1 TaxID=1450539 RepID=A0A318ZLT8_9EURO|nr:C6 finger domain protein [Aspergillus saccharolyticus JOP 1030-1]PYH47867.1 C6 finger domain protein [Aspergillus saccharolyticus JOP 1030-1]